MERYKLEITLDLDFTQIIENKLTHPDYYKHVILGCLKNAHISALKYKEENLKRDSVFHQILPHIECQIQTSKQMLENIKITKI